MSKRIITTCYFTTRYNCFFPSYKKFSSSVTPTYDEGEVRTKKKFHFPSHLVQAAIGACRSVSSSEIASSDDSFAHDTSTVRSYAPCNVAEDTLLHDTTVSFPVTRNLVKTDRRSFIILKIKK